MQTGRFFIHCEKSRGMLVHRWRPRSLEIIPEERNKVRKRNDMKNQMTVGKRIVLGLSPVILISLVIGGLAIRSMIKVKLDSYKPADEYISQVKVATDLRGALNSLMYDMRGYDMSEGRTYYEEAKTKLDALNRRLGEATNRADKSVHLKALKKEIDNAATAVNKYATLMEQTETAGKTRESFLKALPLFFHHHIAPVTSNRYNFYNYIHSVFHNKGVLNYEEATVSPPPSSLVFYLLLFLFTSPGRSGRFPRAVSKDLL